MKSYGISFDSAPSVCSEIDNLEMIVLYCWYVIVRIFVISHECATTITEVNLEKNNTSNHT